MNKTKIEWCDSTWNPVTGCLHGCEYCYARGIARRFGGFDSSLCNEPLRSELDRQRVGIDSTPRIRILNEQLHGFSNSGDMKAAPYPFGFVPTFHRYRLDEPAKLKKPQKIFVCSMADLFGEWVPDEWIKAVFEACEAAPQHTYLFLTKNPKRYEKLAQKGNLPCRDNVWYGSTITTHDDDYYYSSIGGGGRKRFLSIEPLQGRFEPIGKMWTDWVIIGAETGNRKDKVTPKREWIENIVEQCQETGTPVFMKNSLADIWGEPLIQQWPKEMDKQGGLTNENTH